MPKVPDGVLFIVFPLTVPPDNPEGGYLRTSVSTESLKTAPPFLATKSKVLELKKVPRILVPIPEAP